MRRAIVGGCALGLATGWNVANVGAIASDVAHAYGVSLAVVGVFSFEIAETKVTQVMDFARKHQHPLQCVMEKK